MTADDALMQQAARRVGTVLCGKYTVDRVLGVGGMAVVYAATHRNLKRVAIKMLHPELAMNAEIKKRFLREGYVANSVKHKGSVDVIDDDTAEDGAAFIVMELLDGEPLDAVLQARGNMLPLQPALVVMHELCGVLASAHAAGVVHRDIKPANIFVTKDGELKVLDFGIARLRDASGAHATNTGMAMGTPAYMAPEQARGLTNEIGPATDVWAIGATLFLMLTGAMVHEAATPQLMMIQVATTPARSIATVAPSLPQPVVAIVDKALGFAPQQRWESATAMRMALRDAHRALFGEMLPAHVLAPLAGGEVARESVVASPSDPGALPVSAPLLSPRAQTRASGGGTLPLSAPVPSAPAASAPRPIGGTTAQPVSAGTHDPSPPSGFVQPVASRLGLFVIAGVVLVALAGGGIFVATRGGQPASGTVTGSASVVVTAPESASASPSATASAPAVASAPASASAAVSASPTEASQRLPVRGTTGTTRTATAVASAAVVPAQPPPPSAPAPPPSPPPAKIDPGSVR